MPRPNVTLRADVADDLLDRLNSLARGLDEAPGETLADWAPEIRALRMIVQDAVDDAETRSQANTLAPRDSQRTKVYRAQKLVSDRPRIVGLAEQRHYLACVMATDWFRAYFPDLRFEALKVETLTSRTAAGDYWAFGKRIRLERAAADLTLLHELAHACVDHYYGRRGGVAAHGPEFVGMLLFLVVTHLGKPVGRKLAEGIITAGVKYTQLHKQTRKTPVAPDYIRALVAQRSS